MKLKVIAGAKEGVEVPLKKSKFVIGRASDCTLRASSDAISRHHCALLRGEDGEVTVRDLGSRNGTLINGAKINGDTPLANGDELQVGPLRFLVMAPAELKREKKPAVKSVAEAVERASHPTDSVAEDDDISRWLLGPEPAPSPASMHETQSLKLDETQIVGRPALAEDPSAEEPDAEAGEETLAISDTPDESLSGSKSGKRKKAKPGKLPPVPTKPMAKDSREAAADILREMARRR